MQAWTYNAMLFGVENRFLSPTKTLIVCTGRSVLGDATGALPPCQEGAVSYTRTHLAAVQRTVCAVRSTDHSLWFFLPP